LRNLHLQPGTKRSRFLVCLALAIAALALPLPAQSERDDFTIVVVLDVHAPNGPPLWVSDAKWIAANCPAWNCRAIVAVGDYVNNPTVPAEWQDFVAGYNIVMSMDLPVVWPPGNHDIGYSQGYTSFDTQFGGAYSWASCYPDCAHPHNQFAKVDVPTRSGVIKLGILGMDIFQNMSSGQPAAWAEAILNEAEPDRQFFYASHMLVAGASAVPGTGAWCSDITTCVGGSADPHTTGLGQWQDFIRVNPKIQWTLNGHAGYNPASLATTAADGHTVHSFGQAGASGGTHTGIALLKFQPRANRIEVTYWDPLLNAQRTDMFPGDHWAWTPQLARPQTRPPDALPKRTPAKKAARWLRQPQ
jgi:hypothetical protein